MKFLIFIESNLNWCFSIKEEYILTTIAQALKICIIKSYFNEKGREL